MRIYNNYILSLVLAACITDTVLAFLGQSGLDVYFTVNVLAFLIITLLYVHFSPQTRKALNVAGGVFFAGFMVIVAIKVVEILAKP